ncbi:MAG: hypothetical protein QHJ73_08430, partial [Armatimonadota bacterium]|nr:hypothetical protein [Armatimonadota bacterium]
MKCKRLLHSSRHRQASPPLRRPCRVSCALLVAGWLLHTAGCGSGESTQPPRITVARVDPSTLPSSGGEAKVRAHVEGSVSWVRATVDQPDG